MANLEEKYINSTMNTVEIITMINEFSELYHARYNEELDINLQSLNEKK
jgi:hypothetical protein